MPVAVQFTGVSAGRDINIGGWEKHPELLSASDLRPESFKLGDTTAATFPYVITPIQDTYSNAILGRLRCL